MKITIFCKRTLRVVHYHPHLELVSASIAAQRPHLAEPHEHAFVLTVGLHVEAPNRVKDLLLLHETMERLVEGYRDLGQSSFEDICLWVKSKIPDACMVRIEQHDEGAEIEFEEQRA